MIKKKDILIILAILFLITSFILPKNFGDLDEIWNYNFAKNILEGKAPYKDFNMIQTPLLPIIASLFLKIFGNELIIMRILAIILCTTIFFLIYKILEERLKINSKVSLISTLGIIWIFQEHVRIDYNFIVLLIVLILIYIELKNDKLIKYNFKRDILIGILAGSAILFKQTTGMFIALVTIGYKLLIISKKEELQEFIKIAFARTAGAIIPILFLIIYISLLGIWRDFIDYTIVGVKTFSNYLPYSYLFKNNKPIIKMLAVMLPIMIAIEYFFGIVKNDNTKKNKNYLILFSFSVANAIVIFPITDEIHFLIGMLPCIICAIYFIYNIFSKILKGKIKIFIKSFIECASIGILILYIIILINPMKEYIQNLNKYQYLQHFRNIPISEGLEKQIEIVDEYIKNSTKEVYILDATASVYMIPIDNYNKNYDMFLKGNLGAEGEKGIIEELKEKNNSKILIMKEGLARNWQNPEDVRKYIIENWKKTEEIACFEVYEK